MSRRHTVCDMAGNELYAGDLICHSARQGNTVRMSDFVIEKVTTRLIGGRIRPTLVVRPTGVESGFIKRRSMRREEIETTHVRLVTPGEDL